MPPDVTLEDEEYASSEDSDFAPDAAPALAVEESSDEESEEEQLTVETKRAKPKPAKRKRGTDEEAEDAGIENSGDEAIIEKGLKRQRRKKGKDVEDDDEGGEGGLVKTRSMRAQEKIEKKPLVNTSAATVDVDALYAAMLAGEFKPEKPAQSTEFGSTIDPTRTLSPETQKRSLEQNKGKESRSPSTTLNDGPDSMVMIKRTYNFAGKIHTEQKLVSRNSAEGKLFLASQANTKEKDVAPEDASPFTKPKRPTKKARRSMFEPVSDLPLRSDLHFGIRKDGNVVILGAAGKDAKKLNTVEKSAMDWAGFVDKEGIADELDAAGKSKGAYKSRQEFLARVEQKKEEDSRRARGLPL